VQSVPLGRASVSRSTHYCLRAPAVAASPGGVDFLAGGHFIIFSISNLRPMLEPFRKHMPPA
jgi:hypothetical protein